MRLITWSTNLAGEPVNLMDNTEVEVSSFAEATAVLASNLAETASDDFLHDALKQWFDSGKIEKLPEGGEVFWNVELDATEDKG